MAALAPEASEEDSPPVITDEVTADVQHAAAEAAATEPEIASPSADAEIASPPVEPEIPSPPAELAPEPIDPQPVIEDVHQNLEPDVVAGAHCLHACCLLAWHHATSEASATSHEVLAGNPAQLGMCMYSCKCTRSDAACMHHTSLHQCVGGQP